MRLAAAVLCLASCMRAPSLVWSGHTADRRHELAVVHQGNVEWVTIDGARRAAYRAIAAWSLVAADADRVVYAAMRGDRWSVVDNGVVSREAWDAIGEIVVAPHRLAYAAERVGSWYVVVDGSAEQAWSEILAHTLRFSRDGTHHVYVARDRGRGRDGAARDDGAASNASPDDTGAERDAGNTHVVVDGMPGAGWTGVGQLVIADDDKVLYAARRGDEAHVVTVWPGTSSTRGPRPEGTGDLAPRIGPAYRNVTRLDASGAYAALAADGWHVVNPRGELGGPYDAVQTLITRDEHVAWIARAGAEDVVACDGEVVGRAAAAAIAGDSLVMLSRPCDLAYVAKDAAGARLVRGGMQEPVYDEISGLAARGDHIGYAGRRAGRWSVIVDGQERGAGTWASKPVFSADGARVGFLVQRDRRIAAIVDGTPHWFDTVLDGSFAFSRNGRRWAVIAGDFAREQLFFAIDGEHRVPLSSHELYSAAAMRSLSDSLLGDPDDTLRAWSAAEAERAESHDAATR
jgi:hypothetical protein